MRFQSASLILLRTVSEKVLATNTLKKGIEHSLASIAQLKFFHQFAVPVEALVAKIAAILPIIDETSE